MPSSNHTTGPVHVFDFSPGDGTSYRVLFGRLPPAHWMHHTCLVFGLAEGRDALVTLIFDTDGISAELFGRHWSTAAHTQTVNTPAYLEDAAYAVFAALVGRTVPNIAGWRSDWREHLPTAALG